MIFAILLGFFSFWLTKSVFWGGPGAQDLTRHKTRDFETQKPKKQTKPSIIPKFVVNHHELNCFVF